jgi:hypothetical protein
VAWHVGVKIIERHALVDLGLVFDLIISAFDLLTSAPDILSRDTVRISLAQRSDAVDSPAKFLEFSYSPEELG